MISKENAEHYTWGTHCDGWHLVKSANLSIIQELIPPNAAEVKHYHEKAEQFFFVLSGVATIEVAGTVHKLTAQTGIHVPAQVPHKVENCGSDNLEIVVTSTPPSHGDRVAL